jgi:hypothetical protein
MSKMRLLSDEELQEVALTCAIRLEDACDGVPYFVVATLFRDFICSNPVMRRVWDQAYGAGLDSEAGIRKLHEEARIAADGMVATAPEGEA